MNMVEVPDAGAKEVASGSVGALCALFILVPNLLVLAVVSRTRSLWTVPTLYMLSLCLADILAGALVLPVAILTHLNLPSTALCRTMSYLLHLVEAAGVYSLVIIAYDRFRVIVFRKRIGTTRARALIIISGVWAVAVGYPMYKPFKYGVANRGRNGTGSDVILECVIGDYGPGDVWSEIARDLLLVDFLFLFGIPLILITAFYTIVVVRANPAISEEVTVSRRQWRVFQTVSVLLVTFVTFTLPLYILDMYVYIGPGVFPGERVARQVLEAFSLSVYGLNAIMYALYWPPYRRALAALLHLNNPDTSLGGKLSSMLYPYPLQRLPSDVTGSSRDLDSGVESAGTDPGAESPQEVTPKLCIPGHGVPGLGVPGMQPIMGLAGVTSGALHVPQVVVHKPLNPRRRWIRGMRLSLDRSRGGDVSTPVTRPTLVTPPGLCHVNTR